MSRRTKFVLGIVVVVVVILAVVGIFLRSHGLPGFLTSAPPADAAAPQPEAAAQADTAPQPKPADTVCPKALETCIETIKNETKNIKLAADTIVICKQDAVKAQVPDISALQNLGKDPTACKQDLKTCEDVRSAAVKAFAAVVAQMKEACPSATPQ